MKKSENISSPITVIDWDEQSEGNLQTEEQKLLKGLEQEADEKMKLRYMDFVRIMRRNENNDKEELPDQIRQLIAGMQYFEIKIKQMELQDKDVIVVVGPPKSGKGILSLALMGRQVKKFNPFDLILENPEFKSTELGKKVLK